MNDLEILDRFGPTATGPTPAALAAARARLDTAIDSSAPGRGRRRLPLLVAAAAAAAGIGLAPALVGSDDSIALASVDPLTFPVTPTWLPEGLGKPVFTYESGALEVARYGSGDDRVSIAVLDEPESPCLDDDAVPIDVNGQEGWGFDDCADEPPGPATNAPVYFVLWERPDGDALRVSGGGKYADPALVERFAESVQNRSQPVDLFLTTAPMGWKLHGYQSDHHVMWTDPDGEGGDGSDLTVNLLDRIDDDLSEYYGARDVHTVHIDGRRARIGKQVNEEGATVTWILLSTAPDGTAFSLLAPGRFTEEQVIEVAAGVRHR